MIDEDDLRRLLADTAEAVPPPGDAPQALLDAVAQQTSVAPARQVPPVRLAGIAAAVVVVVALGAAFLAGGESSDLASSGATVEETGAAIGDEGGGSTGGTGGGFGDGDGAVVVAPSASTLSGGGGGGSAARDAATPATPDASTGEVTSAQDGAKVVKTGSIDLEVPEGGFDRAVDRITSQTVGLGGYVAESTTNESSDRPSGSLVLRVPAESFEALVSGVRELGDVRAATAKGTDVTAQFTDLAARLRALEATRERLGVVLAEATNVPDILAVQDRITTVQMEIEQLQGRQRQLEDQASFASLAVTVGEPGSERIEPRGDDGLGEAWDDARRRFGDSLEAIVSWSGSAAVVALVLLVALLLGRLAWIGVRRRLV